MKKIFLFLSIIVCVYSVGMYLETCLFYTFHPVDKEEVTKTDISHKELRQRGVLPDTKKCYRIVHTKRYLYEGHYFYVNKILVDSLKDGYDTFDITN